MSSSSSSSHRYLIVTMVGGGNQHPALGLAQRLRKDGHEVIFAGFEPQRSLFADEGFEFILLPQSNAGWAAVNFDQSRWGEFEVANPALIQDVPTLIKEKSPDRVIIDCLMAGALAALELSPPLAPITSWVFLHTTPIGFKSANPMLLPPFNMLRSAVGLKPINDIWDAYRLASPHAIVSSIPELDHNVSTMLNQSEWKDYFQFIGPLIPSVTKSSFQLPWANDDRRPLILANFSSGEALFSQKSRIIKTVEALSDSTKYRVVLTYNDTPIDDITPKENMIFVKQVPHSEIIHHTSLVLTHAGHGTVCIALAHGIPLICLPSFADQHVNAKQVANIGAGIELDGENATAEEIKSAVDKVLDEPSYKSAAQSIQKIIREYSSRPLII